MFRPLFILIIFCISLFALDNSDILKRANAYMQTGSKSDKFLAYDDYKNLYLRSIMSSDEKLRKNSLKGIVESGKALHIDISQYRDELATFKVKSTYTKPLSKSSKNNVSSPKSSHKLKSISWSKKERLVLRFNKNLTQNQINYFTLYDEKNKKYRYVFDIHASMLSKSQTLRKNGVKRIKIAQYKPNTLRLVIENSTKLDVNFKKTTDTITININTKFVKPKEINYVPISLNKSNFKNKIIVIDAGHGGKDPGAVGYKKYREKIVVLKIAKYLKKNLTDRGYKVYMTRDKDKQVKLNKRTAFANKKNADLFISIHANAVDKKYANKVHGVECYFLSPSRSKRAESVAAKENSADLSQMNFYGKKNFLKFLNHAKTIASHKLAIDLQRGMLGSLNKYYKGVKDGGVREGPFWVLVGAQMPAVLVEVGYITHPIEAKRLVDDKYRKRMAKGMADGIERYFRNNH